MTFGEKMITMEIKFTNEELNILDKARDIISSVYTEIEKLSEYNIAHITSDTSIDFIDEDELIIAKRCLEVFGLKTKATVEEKGELD